MPHSQEPCSASFAQQVCAVQRLVCGCRSGKRPLKQPRRSITPLTLLPSRKQRPAVAETAQLPQKARQACLPCSAVDP